MQKLIKLLNEYEKNRIEKINSEWKLMVKLSFRPYTEESLTNKAYRSCWGEICSKYYWFIKRLVENDKIDLKKLYEKEIESWWDFDWPKTNSEDLSIEFANQYNTEIALMLLSISSTPIEDLISYLR